MILQLRLFGIKKNVIMIYQEKEITEDGFMIYYGK